MTDTRSPQAARRPRAAGSFPHAWTIFSIGRVPVRVERSFLLVAGLVAWLLYGQFARILDGFGLAVASAIAATLLFFGSVLAHELGHALTSVRRDIPVTSITLFALGGVTEAAGEARSARHEFVVVGIGPFISLVLAAAFGLLATWLSGLRPFDAIAGYLGWTNLALAVFNVIPGYPLDGGRLLRALLWALSGQPHRATRWAARVGQAFAVLLIGAGLATFLGRVGGFGGLWEVLIGFFLLRGATDSHRRARVRERLAGRRARDVMGTVPPTLPAHLPLDAAVGIVRQRPSLLWPVGDPLRGGLLLGHIDAVPADRWAFTTVGEVAHPADEVAVEAAEQVDTVIDRLANAPGTMLIVVDGGRPVGLVTPSLVTHLVA